MNPQGYLTLNVGNLGAVKIAGKLADGTAVSGSAKLLEGLNKDGWMCVALHKALYTKAGFIGGLLWLNPADRLVRVDTTCGWHVDWVKAGAFESALDVVGGMWTGQSPNLTTFGAVLAGALDGYTYDGAVPKVTAKTGAFKGTFKLYGNAGTQGTSANVSYMGVVVPMDKGGFAGFGIGTATVNRQKVGVPVLLIE